MKPVLPSFSWDDFAPSAPPPPLLYKYMIADRAMDVLGFGMVRFTHLLNTNDSFEVRKTYKQFAGPKLEAIMQSMIEASVTEDLINENMKAIMQEQGIVGIPISMMKEIVEQQLGVPVDQFIRQQMSDILPGFTEALNKLKTPEEFLAELGSSLLCFSLSERFDSPPMWAHYGGGHTGLVVCFQTDHPWFKRDDGKSMLQKVVYVDDQLDEPFENPQAAFISKTTDWSYEREWRLNCGIDHIEKTVGAAPDPIHLRSFPPEALHSVIVGAKATDALVNEVRGYLQDRYSHAKLQRAIPQPMAVKYELHDI